MKVFVSTFLVAGLALSGCATRSTHIPSFEKLASVQVDGLISISRAAPLASSLQTGPMLGFVPTSLGAGDKWLQINRAAGTISLMEGDKVLETANGEGFDGLQSGTFSLMHKQRDPLWYARDEYFQKRALPVPPEGDKERFRRGALGEFALFVDQDTPIHDGPIWSEDVGGLRLPDESIKKIYYLVDVGTPVEIK